MSLDWQDDLLQKLVDVLGQKAREYQDMHVTIGSPSRRHLPSTSFEVHWDGVTGTPIQHLESWSGESGTSASPVWENFETRNRVMTSDPVYTARRYVRCEWCGVLQEPEKILKCACCGGPL